MRRLFAGSNFDGILPVRTMLDTLAVGRRDAVTPVKKDTNKSPKSVNASRSNGFTEEERAAMKEHARELKAGKVDGESAVLAKIAEMQEPDRTMASQLHSLIKANAPTLVPRTWYGMPAYARNGEVVCFFQSAQKFKVRYATLGFSDKAKLDDGRMWPTAFALREMTAAEETRIIALLKQAVG
jgi:uncharacterized protein YdhG (YjbR/CyaY superfamily)